MENGRGILGRVRPDGGPSAGRVSRNPLKTLASPRGVEPLFSA